jgi:hypothetical protein
MTVAITNSANLIWHVTLTTPPLREIRIFRGEVSNSAFNEPHIA